MFFEETSVGRDTWGILSDTQCAMCQAQVQSTLAQGGAHDGTWHDAIGWKSQSGWLSG